MCLPPSLETEVKKLLLYLYRVDYFCIRDQNVKGNLFNDPSLNSDLSLADTVNKAGLPFATIVSTCNFSCFFSVSVCTTLHVRPLDPR